MKNKKYILALLAGTLMSSNVYAAASIKPVGEMNIGKTVLRFNEVTTQNGDEGQTMTRTKVAINGVQIETQDDLAKFLANIVPLSFEVDQHGVVHGVKFMNERFSSVPDLLKSISFKGFGSLNKENMSSDQLPPTSPEYQMLNAFLQSIVTNVQDADATQIQNIQNQLTLYQKAGDKLNLTVEQLQDAQDELKKMSDKQVQQLTALRQDIDPLLTVMEGSMGSISNLIETRMDNFAPKNQPKEIAVAAGDESQSSYGLWVRGMLGTAKQRVTNNNPAYKLDQNGASIGFDFGDDYLLGIAYTFLNSKVKDVVTHDKITSNVGTIYGLYNFDNNFFVNGQLKYGKSNIKKHRNIKDSQGNIAYGKTKSDNYGGEVEVGYYYNFMDSSQFIPSVSIAYDYVKVKGYQESGKGLNRTVSKRTGKQTSTNLELMLNHTLYMNELIMVPEIHTNIDYAIHRKNAGTTITLFKGVTPIYIPATKPSKVHYNIGGSVKLANQKKFDITLGYDFSIAKKFRSHAGYIQARVNI